MTRFDRFQLETWREKHEKIMCELRDGEFHTVYELSSSTGFSPNTIYKHLNTLTKVDALIWEAARFRLRPLWPMPDEMVRGMSRGLESLHMKGLRVQMSSDENPNHWWMIGSDGHLSHFVRVLDAYRLSDSHEARVQRA
jgi:DNA-binding transcriptional ArsR family regulator